MLIKVLGSEVGRKFGTNYLKPVIYYRCYQ